MTVPRFRIAWLMAVVAIVALNFGAMRGWSNSGPGDEPSQVLILGALPMANVLAVGLLSGRRRLGDRPYLLGFVVFGATALVLFVAWASRFTKESVMPYLDLVLRPLVNSFGSRAWTLDRQLIVYFVAAVMLGLPQLAFALVGGLVVRRFRNAERSGQPSC